MNIATLQTQVRGAFAWLGLLTFASGVAFLFLLSQIGEVNKGISNVQTTVAGQSATLQAVKESVDRLSDKLDKRP